MKFIELLNGDLLNVDAIKRIYWTCKERQAGNLYFSHIEGNDSTVYNFLDIPIYFPVEIEGIDKIDIDFEHVNILHQIAIGYIISHYKDGVISQEQLDQDVWNTFIRAATIKYKEDNKK